VLKKLGLTTGLIHCLDAGDEASVVSSAATQWFDISGGDNHFDEQGAATFNGTVGRRSADEYFQHTGSSAWSAVTPDTDYDNLHSDNQSWSHVGWLRTPASWGSSIEHFTTAEVLATHRGVYLRHSTSNVLQLIIGNGSGTSFTSGSYSNSALPTEVWAFFGISCTISSGAISVSLHLLSRREDGINPTTSGSPSALAATQTCYIDSDISSDAPSGLRRAAHAMWKNYALSVAEMEAIYGATRGKYGV
jgi:hypothetical protein